MTRKQPIPASLFLMILCFLLFPPATAAQSGMEDVIYFKNGEIIRGEIIERDGEDTFKIETHCRNVVLVKNEEIQKITREQIPSRQYYKSTGYINRTGIDILSGQGSNSVSFQTVNGYRFTPLLSAGLGIGYTPYSDPLDLIPLFIEIRYQLIHAQNSPFVFLKTGHGFSILSDEESSVDRHGGGYTLNPGIGIRIDTGNGYGWYFNAGYNIDHASFEQDIGGGQVLETELTYKRLHFGFGLSF